MSELVLRSNHGSDRLIVSVAEADNRWQARIEFANLTAKATVYERCSGDALRLDVYFSELANAWQGWEGEKVWEGLGLRLAAKHDGLGHVRLDAILEEDYAMADRWRLRATLSLDAGILTQLAREARVLDRS
jgi:uncharacterized protein DUF6228